MQATIKHFIANEQEHFRGDGQVQNTISSNVDDRTLHETYLWPFSEGVRAGVASVMCSYNMVFKLESIRSWIDGLTRFFRSTDLTDARTASYSMGS